MTTDSHRTSLTMAGRLIADDQPPFIVAEMSGNHNQSLERALAIVEAAAKAGAHAVKIQTYTADTMTIESREGAFMIRDPESLWNGRSLHELYRQASTPWDWHKPILDRCHELGLIGFSTAFDESSIDYLESLDVPCHKIASFENIDIPLVQKAASTGKPLIISTGMASLEELTETVHAARHAGARDLVLLKCTSEYPAAVPDCHLLTIPDMRERFRCLVGLSDHTLGTAVAVSSVALGATVIEKHFTLSRAEGGVDSAFSLEPAELAALVSESRLAWQALGEIRYGPTKREENSLQFRRSLYITRDIKAGDTLTRDNCRSIRPSGGLPPKHISSLIGRRVKRDVRRGTPVQWDLLT